MRPERSTRRRIPRIRRTEAIVVHKSAQVDTYAEILRKIKNNIDIDEIGIRDTRIRRTATGSLLIQISGEHSKQQADGLANKMKEVVGPDAKIDRPCRKSDIRIVGLDEHTREEDVAVAIIGRIGCDRQEMKVGNIRRNRMGIGDVWVKCPRVPPR